MAALFALKAETLVDEARQAIMVEASRLRAQRAANCSNVARSLAVAADQGATCSVKSGR